ncbi:putative Beta-lactamase [Bradyrhizobium sp. ORS 278]|uniref:serine hydrolase domain-containing protein n=1 Tax=Bradyrhizobium sp. (strain ORS 278) TaxID=114615 RepID=UPI00015083D7|nr:serine hydrolase [Bradyrhizobium sp. ORS 278]CAL79999.1 putative Beta-lactamase [Bradyrhizobium sp. ORS 278]
MWRWVKTAPWLFVAIAMAAPATSRAEGPGAIVARFPAAHFETTTPEDAGWSVDQLTAAKAWSLKIAPTAAVMIIQHGRIVAEWGDIATKSNLHSARKSLLSALIGIAVSDHRIDLNATLATLGIDDNSPGLSEEEKSATVADLIKARSGVYHAALYETPGMARRRPPRFSHAPGTFWYYNNWDFNALGTIYEKATAQSIFDAFNLQIARPIGMQDYQPSDGSYVRGAASNHAAYPIRMSARDLARFALLYLHDGRWGDRQVIPAAWVRESTRAYSDAYTEFARGLGYGYLWWVGFPHHLSGAPAVQVPAGTYAAMGAEGQYAFVIPSLDLVIVHRINSDPALEPVGPRKREPTFRQIARLLWLILSAAGDRDVGPDASIARADGARPDVSGLKTAMSGKSLRTGSSLKDGAYAWELHADGTLSMVTGADRHERWHGNWRVDDGARFCRSLDDGDAQLARERCYDVVLKDAAVQLFGPDGLMEFDMRVE